MPQDFICSLYFSKSKFNSWPKNEPSHYFYSVILSYIEIDITEYLTVNLFDIHIYHFVSSLMFKKLVKNIDNRNLIMLLIIINGEDNEEFTTESESDNDSILLKNITF